MLRICFVWRGELPCRYCPLWPQNLWPNCEFGGINLPFKSIFSANPVKTEIKGKFICTPRPRGRARPACPLPNRPAPAPGTRDSRPAPGVGASAARGVPTRRKGFIFQLLRPKVRTTGTPWPPRLPSHHTGGHTGCRFRRHGRAGRAQPPGPTVSTVDRPLRPLLLAPPSRPAQRLGQRLCYDPRRSTHAC